MPPDPTPAETATLNIEGMTCASTEQATVEYAAGLASPPR